jgi:hypothetical protein
MATLQDGRINYTEFAAMMRKGDPEVANPKKRRDVVLQTIQLQARAPV